MLIILQNDKLRIKSLDIIWIHMGIIFQEPKLLNQPNLPSLCELGFLKCF